MLRRIALSILFAFAAITPHAACGETEYVWIAQPLEQKMREPLRRLLPLMGYNPDSPEFSDTKILTVSGEPYVFVAFGGDHFCIHTVGCLTLIVRFEGEQAVTELITYSDGIIGILDFGLKIAGQPAPLYDIVTMRKATRLMRSPAGWVVALPGGILPGYLPPRPMEQVSPPPPLPLELRPPPSTTHEDFKRRLYRLR